MQPWRIRTLAKLPKFFKRGFNIPIQLLTKKYKVKKCNIKKCIIIASYFCTMLTIVTVADRRLKILGKCYHSNYVTEVSRVITAFISEIKSNKVWVAGRKLLFGLIDCRQLFPNDV